MKPRLIHAEFSAAVLLFYHSYRPGLFGSGFRRCPVLPCLHQICEQAAACFQRFSRLRCCKRFLCRRSVRIPRFLAWPSWASSWRPALQLLLRRPAGDPLVGELQADLRAEKVRQIASNLATKTSKMANKSREQQLDGRSYDVLTVSDARNSLSLDSEGERGPLSGNQCVRSWIELRLAQAQVTDGRSSIP